MQILQLLRYLKDKDPFPAIFVKYSRLIQAAHSLSAPLSYAAEFSASKQRQQWCTVPCPGQLCWGGVSPAGEHAAPPTPSPSSPLPD